MCLSGRAVGSTDEALIFKDQQVIEIIDCGLRKADSTYCYANPCQTNLYVCAVLTNNLTLTMSNTILEVKKGMIYYIPPGTNIVVRSGERGFLAVYARFPKGVTHSISRTTALVANPFVLEIAENIFQEMTKRDAKNREIVHPLFQVFTYRAFLEYRHFRDARRTCLSSEEWANIVKQRVRYHLYDDIKLAELLASLPITYRQLYNHFYEYTGMSIKDFQLQERIVEARKLLTESDLSITTIAHELCFSSSQHFATCFKNSCGLSPSEFRKSAHLPENIH